MITHVWTVVCTRSIQDAESKNVSLIDVIEQINVGDPRPSKGEVRLAPISVDVVTLWAREPSTAPDPARARVAMVSPEGKTMGEATYNVDLSANVRLRSVTRIAGIPISEEGVMRFQVDLEVPGKGWDRRADVPVQIVALGAMVEGGPPADR